MKKNKSCCVSTSILLTGVVIAILFLAAYIFYIRPNTLEEKRAASAPPTVMVTSPTAGDSIPAGSLFQANVTAIGQNPISRIEFWLDGSLFETQTPPIELGAVNTFYASTSIKMTEGPHMLSARTVDANGLVGQSLPINLHGSPRQGQNENDPAQPMADGEGGQPAPGGGASQPAPENPPPDTPSGQTKPLPDTPIPEKPPGIPMLVLAEMTTIDFSKLFPNLLSGLPKAPTYLQGGFENCTIRLTWVDNADNETRFNVWIQALGGPPKVIATLNGSSQTGPAWYEFGSPWSGIYSFWIEAVNGLGGQSSEIVWVAVNDLNCGPNVATHLNVEIMDMYVPGGYSQVYCYLSVEAMPEKRVPVNEKEFIAVMGGWAEVSNWTGSGSSFLLPEPADNEVTLDGECLGWQGGSGPDILGTFNASAPLETWDGRRLELTPSGGRYTIGYRIIPYGFTQAQGNFHYTDFTIPTPSQPWVKIDMSSNAAENEKFARRPTLHWNWSGDPNTLTGFTILENGQFFRSVPNWQGSTPGQWEQMFLLPTSCGGSYKFQVIANSGEAQSPPSPIYEYKQPNCNLYAEVKFETLTLTDVDDGELGSCDDGKIYYSIGVNNEWRQFWEFEGPDVAVTCGTFGFDRLAVLSPQEHDYKSTDTFIVPLSIQNPFTNNVYIAASMNENDPVLFDDADGFCFPSVRLKMSTQEWSTYNEQLNLPCGGPNNNSYDGEGYITVSVKGFTAPNVNP